MTEKKKLYYKKPKMNPKIFYGAPSDGPERAYMHMREVEERNRYRDASPEHRASLDETERIHEEQKKRKSAAEKQKVINKKNKEGLERSLKKYKKKKITKSRSGFPGWEDYSPDDSEKGREIKEKMRTIKTYENMKARIDAGDFGEQSEKMSQQQKIWIREELNSAIRRAKKEITIAHGKKRATTSHGGMSGLPKFLKKIPKLGAPALAPLIWLEEYVETGKTPAMISDFMKIPQLPQMFKEAFKEIKDAKRNRDEKEAKSVLGRLMKKNKEYYPKK